MLCGAYPFTADNILQTVVMRMSQDPEPLRDKAPGIDPEIERIVMRALARNRHERFSDARAMRQALAAWVGGFEETPFVPTSAGPGRGVPLFDSLEPKSGPTKTYVATSKSEAKKLRGMRRRRRLKTATWVAGVGLVVALGGFAIFGLWSTVNGGGEGALPSDSVENGAAPVTIAVRNTTTAGLPLREPEAEPAGENPTRIVGETPAPPTPTPAPPTPAPPTPAPVRQPWERPRLLEDAVVRVPAEIARPCSGEVVRLSVRIDEAGAVTAVRILSWGNQSFCAEYAQEAVRAWRYEPAKDIDGVPLPASLSVAFPFSEVPDESPDGR